MREGKLMSHTHEVMTGGEAVVRALAAHDVTTVFGIPGTHNLAIFAAMPSYGITNVTTRHEQGAGYAADGYARSSGRVGVVVTTTGPAALNAAAALAQANSDAVPTLLIAPGMPTGHPSRGNGLLHELRNQQHVFTHLVAESHRVESLEEIPVAVAQAFGRMRAGTPTSEYLEIPLDLLDASGAIPPVVPLPSVPGAGAPVEAVREAADVLRAADRVLMIVGGGSAGASLELRALAERLHAPVVSTTNGKGAFDERHELALGAGVHHDAIRQAAIVADAVIAIGTEFSPADWWEGVPDCAEKLVRIDIDPSSLITNIASRFPLLGDAKATVTGLLTALGDRATNDGDDWIQRIRADLDEQRADQGHPWRASMQALQRALPDNAIIAADNAMCSYYGALGFLTLSRPHAFMFPTGVGTLGYGLPAGIGAKVADPDAPVVVLQGDGGIMFTIQELAAAARLGIALPVIVFDNGGYGEIRNEMADRDDPVHSVALGSPDFVALARSLGCGGVRITDDAQLEGAVTEALAASTPTLIHVIERGRASDDMRSTGSHVHTGQEEQ